MLWKCAALSMSANLKNSAVATGLEKSIFIPIPKKGNAKECSNYHTGALISHASKVMFKILQARLQRHFGSAAALHCFSSMWIMNFQMFKLDLEKAEEPETKMPHLLDHRKSKRVPEKHLLLLYWLHQSLWLCGSQKTVENSVSDGNTRPSDLPLEKPICRSGSNS